MQGTQTSENMSRLTYKPNLIEVHYCVIFNSSINIILYTHHMCTSFILLSSHLDAKHDVASIVDDNV